MAGTAGETPELIKVHSGAVEVPYDWHCGPYWSRFFRGLRDEKKIYATKCPSCGRVYIPPREVCGPCFARMDEWVEVGPEGVIEMFTVVRLPYTNPSTGEPLSVPYTDVYVRLDGADTSLMHWLDETDEKKIAVGMRVRAVFRDKRTGTMHDIEHFKLI
ncbi:MAG: Zn-ribbon domain-containing OB-fold protein [Dehalococcoidia bacterium]|nr:Zn-ribbon domain-containing OB-fold protein [Dehalococcoidia bacterium]